MDFRLVQNYFTNFYCAIKTSLLLVKKPSELSDLPKL